MAPPAAAAQGTVAPGSAAGASSPPREIIAPDDETIVWIFLARAGVTPPIAEWARAHVRSQGYTYDPPVNEFNRQEYIDAAARDLQARFDATRDVGIVTLNVRARLSEYDPGYGEFYIDAFAPGHYLTFQALGQEVAVKPTNATAAYTWKVPPEQARLIAERLGSYRSVTITARLELQDALRGAKGGSINARILTYAILDEKGRAIGNIDLSAPPP